MNFSRYLALPILAVSLYCQQLDEAHEAPGAGGASQIPHDEFLSPWQ